MALRAWPRPRAHARTTTTRAAATSRRRRRTRSPSRPGGARGRPAPRRGSPPLGPRRPTPSERAPPVRWPRRPPRPARQGPGAADRDHGGRREQDKRHDRRGIGRSRAVRRRGSKPPHPSPRQALLPVTTRRTGPVRPRAGEQPGPGRGRGAFDGDPELVGQLGLGLVERRLGHGDHLVDPAGHELDGARDRDARRDAVGVGVGGVGVDRPPGPPATASSRGAARPGRRRRGTSGAAWRSHDPTPLMQRAVADRDAGDGRRRQIARVRPRRSSRAPSSPRRSRSAASSPSTSSSAPCSAA